MYNFSIYIGDAVAEGLEDKIDACSRLLIGNMELDDRIEGTSMAELDGERIEAYRRLLIAGNKKIVLLNCSRPAADVDYYKRLFRKAHLLGVESVKPAISEEDKCDEAFISAFKAVCRAASTYGIRVLLENSAAAFLSSDENITSVYSEVKAQNTGIIFNPLEYTRLKSHPFFHMFYNSRLKNDIAFLRVNDGLFIDGSPALPAVGNSEIKELASILLARSFKGYFSIVPYFDEMDFDRYAVIIKMFKKLLMEM